jgi:hypothetical protein
VKGSERGPSADPAQHIYVPPRLRNGLVCKLGVRFAKWLWPRPVCKVRPLTGGVCKLVRLKGCFAKQRPFCTFGLSTRYRTESNSQSALPHTFTNLAAPTSCTGTATGAGREGVVLATAPPVNSHCHLLPPRGSLPLLLQLHPLGAATAYSSIAAAHSVCVRRQQMCEQRRRERGVLLPYLLPSLERGVLPYLATPKRSKGRWVEMARGWAALLARRQQQRGLRNRSTL